MIVRIVRMTFRPEEVASFLNIFEESKRYIRSFEGCRHLELHRDPQNEAVYYTYSHWNSENDLNNYRDSELFGRTWKATKALFADKPMAFSLSHQQTIEPLS